MSNSELNELLVNEFNQDVKGISLWQDAWRRFKKNKMAMIGLVIVSFYIFIALFAPILPIYSYKKQVIDHQYLPPSLTKTAGQLYYERTLNQLTLMAKKLGRSQLNEEELKQLLQVKNSIETQTMIYKGKTVKVNDRKYIMGTDSLGRDLLARIIYGSQVSIAIGIVGTLTSVLLGIIIGAIAGFFGGMIDYIIMRVVDVIYGLPYMMLVIIFMAVLGKNVMNLFLALAVVSWLSVAQIVRGQIISLKNSEFVESARICGAGQMRIIFRHILPNTLGVIIVFSTLRIPSFIMLEAFLSFLGLGISAPMASWGTLLQDAISGMDLYPWQLFFPALAMSVFLFSMNFLGDGLRDALDPQTKNKF